MGVAGLREPVKNHCKTKQGFKLLADAEYHFKMAHYRHAHDPEECAYPLIFANPLTSEYAQAYDQLIEAADTNHVLLVLANFSMAVNRHSDPAVVEFYRAGLAIIRPSTRCRLSATSARRAWTDPLLAHVALYPRSVRQLVKMVISPLLGGIGRIRRGGGAAVKQDN